MLRQAQHDLKCHSVPIAIGIVEEFISGLKKEILQPDALLKYGVEFSIKYFFSFNNS